MSQAKHCIWFIGLARTVYIHRTRPYIFIYGDFSARNTVYTSYIYVSGQPYTWVRLSKVVCTSYDPHLYCLSLFCTVCPSFVLSVPLLYCTSYDPYLYCTSYDPHLYCASYDPHLYCTSYDMTVHRMTLVCTSYDPLATTFLPKVPCLVNDGDFGKVLVFYAALYITHTWERLNSSYKKSWYLTVIVWVCLPYAHISSTLSVLRPVLRSANSVRPLFLCLWHTALAIL